MPWTTPRTWVTGEIVTASIMNTHVKDNLSELRAGGIAISSQAANDIIVASSATQFARHAGFAYNNGTTTLSVPAISLTSGQMLFPSSQNASSNVNSLDDYEEGTWTVEIGGSGGTSGQSYAARTATYNKIGNKVILWFDADLSTKGTITGDVVISGFPFTTAAPGSAGMITYWENTANSRSAYSLFSGAGVTHAGVYIGGTTVSSIQTAEINNTTRFAGFVTFNV